MAAVHVACGNFGLFCVVREVEKFGNSLATPTGQTNLGNSNMLTVDPVLDKSALFSQLNEAYKLDSKVCFEEKATLDRSRLFSHKN